MVVINLSGFEAEGQSGGKTPHVIEIPALIFGHEFLGCDGNCTQAAEIGFFQGSPLETG